MYIIATLMVCKDTQKLWIKAQEKTNYLIPHSPISITKPGFIGQIKDYHTGPNTYIPKTDQNGWRRDGKICVILQSEIMDNETHIKALRRLVCEAAGCEGKSPSDFYSLVNYIESRTHENIGLTTVKRLWQYGGLQSVPRKSTLNLLARAVGFISYDDFCAHYADTEATRNPVLGMAVKTSDLTPSDRLMLRWNPGRELTVEYMGNGTFRVLECTKSKLHVDDTFQAAFFVLGHVAMLANVMRGKKSWHFFETGKLTLVRRL